MNRTPETIYQYYSTEADARGGRFTRKCYKASKPKETFNTQDATGHYPEDKNAEGPWWCSMGPLMRGSENLEHLPWEPRSIAQGPNSEDFQLFASNLNGNATVDDRLAWAFAARWWANYCWQMYDQAVKVAPGIIKGDAPGIKLSVKGWPMSGPADPRFAPKREFTLQDIDGPYQAAIGGTQFLAGMYVLDSTWPLYFGSLNAQIVAKALTSNVLDLILIQFVLKHCGLFFKSCLNPAADPDIMKLLNPATKAL